MTQRGTLLGGRYELDQIIGRGGMAEVWRARDKRLERDVAIKRLRLDLASDPTFQARFRREAQSAAGLNHPNIVAVYDTGEELDVPSQISVPYIVMELVEGVTLRDVLRDGRKILPERALEFTAGVLDALAYSHRAGIIHRDIKPANVMLTPAGAVKVMDFGIARAVADTSATMTQTAAVIGTAQYLSPEQARGEKVDQRSDLYSVGCLLYELLVSEPPFKGDSPVSVAYQHVREAPVPPSQLDSEVTADMDAVTLKALAKSADDRYQDADEMRADVLRAMNHESVHAVVPIPGANDPTAVLASDTARHAAVAAAPVAVASPESPAEFDEEEKKSRKPLIILLVLAGLLLAGMVVAIAMILNTQTPEVTMVKVPAVTGETQASAENSIKNVGLVPEVEPVAGTEEDKGTVVDQNPVAADMVPEGSTVTLMVSQGPDTKRIPPINGKTENEARRLLEEAGFDNVRAKDAEAKDEDINAKEGTVTDSDPKEGADVDPDEDVTLIIATGRSIVPELIGKPLADANDLAKQAGFDDVRAEDAVTDVESEVGKIVKQDPSPGKELTRSDPITVTVGVAAPPPEPEPEPEPELPAVPELIGITVDEAKEVARQAGFSNVRVEDLVTDEERKVGTILKQDPSPGKELAPTGQITVTVGVAAPPPEPEPEPDPPETDPGEDDDG